MNKLIVKLPGMRKSNIIKQSLKEKKLKKKSSRDRVSKYCASLTSDPSKEKLAKYKKQKCAE